MRDIVVTLAVFATIPYILKKPYIGILVWSWLSYMNPHRLAFGFAYSMPFAQIIAIVLFVSMLFSSEKIRLPPMNKIVLVWVIFILWMGLTTIFSYYPDAAWPEYIRVLKIQLVTFVTMMLITDLERLRKLIWVIALSIGFYTVKGGVFTLLTGGKYIVWGPDGTFWGENNALALTGLISIPLMVYLRGVSEQKWVKQGFVIAIIFTLFTVVGSQSRGALVAIVAVGMFFWLKSRSKFVSGFLIVLIAISILAFMPESWFKRMNTIETYDQDSSAMSRINSWYYSINAANDNLLGVGFNSWHEETFLLYAPDPNIIFAAHSIFFSVVADHGWPGTIMFVLIFVMTWRLLSKIIKLTKSIENADFMEINLLARMMQVSFIAYFSGGAFLSLSYFDLPWHLVSIVVILDKYIKDKYLVQDGKLVAIYGTN